MSPSPEIIAVMEARGWTWCPDYGRFRADSASGSTRGQYTIGASVLVCDGAWVAAYGWTGVGFGELALHPSPLEAADEAEAWLRGVLGGFRFPWLKVGAVPVEPVGAKGCHGCKFADGTQCELFDGSPDAWIADHLLPDLVTPKPNAPECPGRVQKEQG